MFKKSVCWALPLLLATTAATAQDAGPWYVGFGVGQATQNPESDIRSGLNSFGSASLSFDDRDTGFKVLGGYRFHRNFAVEAAYGDYGAANYSATTTFPSGRAAGEYSTTATQVAAVGMIPINDSLDLFGKLGVAWWKVEAKGNFVPTIGAGAASSISKSGSDTVWGLGAHYQLANNAALRVEYERFRAGDSSTGRGDVSLLSVGVTLRF